MSESIDWLIRDNKREKETTKTKRKTSGRGLLRKRALLVSLVPSNVCDLETLCL